MPRRQPIPILVPSALTVAGLLTLGSAALSAQAIPDDATILRRLDSVISRQQSTGKVRGAALVVMRDTGTIFQRGYGRPGTDSLESVDPETTVFRAASLSKLFVATAVLQLVETGRARLDEDVNHYLKGFRVSAPGRPPITLEALLTHTSGIQSRMLGALVARPEALIPLDRFFRQRPPQSVESAGAGFSYSNIGMAFAGYLVESISGESFDRYVEEQILRPLGMRHSSFRQPIPPELAAAMADSAHMSRAPLFLPYPAASLVATAGDMGRFVQAHLGGGTTPAGRILRPETEALLLATHWTSHPHAQGVAYGFFESRRGDERALFHTGDAGDHSLIYLLPDRRLGLFVVVRGMKDEGSLPFMETLVSQLYQETASPASPMPVADAATRVGWFAGLYGANGGDPFGIERAAGLLQQIRIEETGPGRIRAGPTLASDRLTGVEIEPYRFQLSDGGILAFGPNREGTSDQVTLTGSIWDPSGMHRIPWYRDTRLTLATILAALLLAAGRLLFSVHDVLGRWRHHGVRPVTDPAGAWARVAWRLSGVTAGALVLGPVATLGSLPFIRPPITAMPPGVTALLACWLMGVIGGTILWAFLPRVWRHTPWTRARRLVFLLLAVLAPAFALVLQLWNLLGFRY